VATLTEDEGEDEGSLVAEALVEHTADRGAYAGPDAKADHNLTHHGSDPLLRHRVGDERETERPQPRARAALPHARDDHGGVVVGEHEQEQGGRHEDERDQEWRLPPVKVLPCPRHERGRADQPGRVSLPRDAAHTTRRQRQAVTQSCLRYDRVARHNRV